MNKIQALIQQLDAVMNLLPTCVAMERARLTDHYYKQCLDAHRIVSLAEKNTQVKNVCSSNK